MNEIPKVDHPPFYDPLNLELLSQHLINHSNSSFDTKPLLYNNIRRNEKGYGEFLGDKVKKYRDYLECV
jgi:hypothetical protein